MTFLAIVLVVIYYSDSITITALLLLLCPYCGYVLAIVLLCTSSEQDLNLGLGFM
ncbi:MAG: hypothetical protein ACI9WC_002495, partial [Arenicella sp.]